MKCEIDARGLACPQPVVLTKNKMKECSEIEITVDNETALENIKRLSSSSGWTCEYTISADFIKIVLKSQNSKTPDSESSPIINSACCTDCESVVVFASDKMGRGDDALGEILMKAFIHTLISIEPIPSKLIFYNSGVILTTEDYGAVDDLHILQEKGVEILICGTCVNYYNIKEKIKTGVISNMYDILSSMSSAGKIINP